MTANVKPLAAVFALVAVGVATAFGVDLPDHEIAGLTTDLVTALVGIASVVAAAWTSTGGKTSGKPIDDTTTRADTGKTTQDQPND